MIESGDEDLRQLVRSLDDLDAELAAGDLGDDDYATLRNDYTVRVADVVRALQDPVKESEPAMATAVGGRASSSVPAVTSQSARSSARTLVVIGTLLFAVGAGWLLARSAGERGLGDALTGSIDQSARQQVVRCQEIGSGDGLLLEAIQCFDDVLRTEPDNVEALSYRAWFLVLAAGPASGSDSEVADEQESELLGAAAVYLDRAIEIDPTYPDARAFRAVVADRNGQSEDVCRQIAELIELEPPPFFLQQTQPLAHRNGCLP